MQRVVWVLPYCTRDEACEKGAVAEAVGTPESPLSLPPSPPPSSPPLLTSEPPMEHWCEGRYKDEAQKALVQSEEGRRGREPRVWRLKRTEVQGGLVDCSSRPLSPRSPVKSHIFLLTAFLN
jgi:hypothetical protein